MDSFEFNKIAGAVLSALLLMFGTATFIELRSSGKLEKPGFTLPVAPPAEGGGETAAPKGVDLVAFHELLKKGDPGNGQAAFKRCATCHTPDKGGKNTTGPNLYGIVGRPKGSHEGFNYSNAIKGKGGDWSYDDLANYLHDPRGFAPGNKMAFAGIKDNAELADLIVYLRTLSDSPSALPN